MGLADIPIQPIKDHREKHAGRANGRQKPERNDALVGRQAHEMHREHPEWPLGELKVQIQEWCARMNVESPPPDVLRKKIDNAIAMGVDRNKKHKRPTPKRKAAQAYSIT